MPAPNVVLQRLADAHPELDDVRWAVRLDDGTVEHIRGEHQGSDNPGALSFRLDDGTTRTFNAGEWVSAKGMPKKPGPDLAAIVFRLWQFGLATQEDYLNRGAWLQAQPEWIEHERATETDPAALRVSEHMHFIRGRGL